MIVTEGVYSPDNYAPSLCELQDGGCRIAWAAYGKHGSRCFVRRFDGQSLTPIEPIVDSDTMQTSPITLDGAGGWAFVWLQKNDETWSVWSRTVDGKIECIHTLPPSAKPYELQADVGPDGELWLAWAQSSVARSSIEVVGQTTHQSLSVGRYNYRPRIAALDGDAYVVWDAYDDGYNVYGSRVSQPDPARVSHDTAWENKATLCRDPDGRLWAAWVLWQDVIHNESTIHQRFALRAAVHHRDRWHTICGSDGDIDVADLTYGMLPDFPLRPALGHQGRRLHPMIRAAPDERIWIFYEMKTDQTHGTLDSRGRLVGYYAEGGSWDGPHQIAEGRVFYELAGNHVVSDQVYALGRDMEDDELHLEHLLLHDSPTEAPTVNMAQWRDIELPTPAMRSEPRARAGDYQLFWADLHCHSAVSVEVEGEPDELGHYARDKAAIDALTVSDNDNFWGPQQRKHARYMNELEWDYVKGNAMVLNDPGRFAMFPGYELTIGDGTNMGRDHRSVMADADQMERDLFNLIYHDDYWSGRRDSPKNVREALAWLKDRGYLALPHPHNGFVNLYDTDVEWGIDLCAAWMISFDLFDTFFNHLDAGRKLAFTASGDSHHRNPGLSGAVTGIWATELTRAALLDAIRARRCYATAGQRIAVEFTINGQIMGSDLAVDSDPLLQWRVVGEDQPYILRIHRDGRLIHEDRFTQQTAGELREFKLCDYRPGRHYYYLEVLSPDPVPQYEANVAHALGAKAWSSPIWVETT